MCTFRFPKLVTTARSPGKDAVAVDRTQTLSPMDMPSPRLSGNCSDGFRLDEADAAGCVSEGLRVLVEITSLISCFI